MGLEKDYLHADPASTPASEQRPGASWVPSEDTPLGPERSRFLGCDLSIFPYALRAHQEDLRTSWRVVFADGGKRLGVERDPIDARLAAEACTRENTCEHCHGRMEDGLCTVGESIDCALDLDRVPRPKKKPELLPVFLIQVDPNDLESLTRAQRMITGLLAELS